MRPVYPTGQLRVTLAETQSVGRLAQCKKAITALVHRPTSVRFAAGHRKADLQDRAGRQMAVAHSSLDALPSPPVSVGPPVNASTILLLLFLTGRWTFTLILCDHDPHRRRKKEGLTSGSVHIEAAWAGWQGLPLRRPERQSRGLHQNVPTVVTRSSRTARTPSGIGYNSHNAGFHLSACNCLGLHLWLASLNLSYSWSPRLSSVLSIEPIDRLSIALCRVWTLGSLRFTRAPPLGAMR